MILRKLPRRKIAPNPKTNPNPNPNSNRGAIFIWGNCPDANADMLKDEASISAISMKFVLDRITEMSYCFVCCDCCD